MRVQDFLDVSSFDKYMIIDEKDCFVDGILDKYNTVKLCGLDRLIEVKPVTKLVKDRISVICVLKVVSDIEEEDINHTDNLEL